MDSGRDAGTKNKKANILKEHIGKVLGNQIFRDVIKSSEFKKGLDTEGLSKLEGLKAELAIRKLRGAVPEKLALRFPISPTSVARELNSCRICSNVSVVGTVLSAIIVFPLAFSS